MDSMASASRSNIKTVKWEIFNVTNTTTTTKSSFSLKKGAGQGVEGVTRPDERLSHS